MYPNKSVAQQKPNALTYGREICSFVLGDMNMSHFLFATGKDIRLACRNGKFTGSTAGHVPGYEQANLTVLPKEHAHSFVVYCVRLFLS